MGCGKVSCPASQAASVQDADLLPPVRALRTAILSSRQVLNICICCFIVSSPHPAALRFCSFTQVNPGPRSWEPTAAYLPSQRELEALFLVLKGQGDR